MELDVSALEDEIEHLKARLIATNDLLMEMIQRTVDLRISDNAKQRVIEILRQQLSEKESPTPPPA